MKIIKIALFCIAISTLTNCASGYKMISPKTINYVSSSENDGVKLEYKYALLNKKYKKKEVKRGVKLVAVKITNNSDKDIVFGKNTTLTYINGNEIFVMENTKVFTTLKQSVPIYLLYLLLTPMNLYTTGSDGQQTSSTPIGLVVGPALAGGNMIAAGSANKKFETELLDYNIYGTTIKKGETKHGLIGIKADSFDSLKLKIE